ncbi:MAG: ATP-dependent helicase [Clostridium sp.]
MFNYERLDKYQLNAVKTNLQNVLVVAAPGSGKTTTIINRVNYLITEKSINSNNIIVITFTKAAAENMKARFIKNTEGRVTPPFFGTFHGLFYRILRRYIEFDIINTNNTYRIIKTQLALYLDEVSEEKVKEIINCISLFKTSTLTMEDFNPDIDKQIFISAYEAYEDYKSKNKLFDFDDLQSKCKEIFNKNPKILEGYRTMFKYILVDEFQDCDMLQISILQSLNYNNSIFAVGDEDQCIYGFRGSRPDCMVDFNKHFNNGQKIYLSNNYRCPRNIVDASMNLIKYNKVRNDKSINAVKDIISPIKVINSINEGIQASEISKIILEVKNKYAFNYSDFAILYRTNLESRTLIESFMKNKLPFRLIDKEYNFFEHFICKDIISYLKLSINNDDRECFCRIINKPFRYFGKGYLEQVKNNIIKSSCFEYIKTLEGLHPYQLLNIDKLRKDINYLNKVSLPVAIDKILSDLGYYEYIHEYATKYKINFQDLVDVINEFKTSAKEYPTIIRFLAHIEEFSEQLEKNKKQKKLIIDGIILSTIHGVKGMEYKNVFIINCNEDYLPHSSSVENNLEEERRLFYVGITRTEVNLWLSISQSVKGSKRETSRFINELGMKFRGEERKFLQINDQLIHKNFGHGIVVLINEDTIDVEFSNGIRRRFDILISFNNGLLKKI